MFPCGRPGLASPLFFIRYDPARQLSGRLVMPILVRYAPPGLKAAQYDEVSEKVQATLEWPPDGLILHVCFGPDGDMRVSEVWESREKLEAFQEGLMPLLVAAGIDVESNAPEFLDVHSIESREYSTDNA